MIKKQIEYKYTCTSGTPQCEYVMIPMLQYSCKDGIIHDRLRDDTVYVADRLRDTVYVADRLRDTVYVADRLRDTVYVADILRDTVYVADRLRDIVYLAESVSGVHLRDNSQCSVLVSQSVNIDSQSSLY